MKKLSCAILILFLLFVLLPASVSAETLDVYVSSTGSDENSGTAEAPYATLDKAIEAVPDNGTIHVVGTVNVSDLKCTKRGYSITITGDTLDMSGMAYLILGDAVTFRDITLTRSTDDDKQVRIYANGYKMVMDTGITTSGNIELFGGGYYAKVNSTDLTVLSGTYKAIYGGGIAGSTSTNGTSQVNGNVNLYVGGTTNANADVTDHNINTCSFVCGGGKFAPVAGTVNLTFTGSAKASYVYGGGYGANATVAGGVHTVVSGNVRAMDVTGGGYHCGENGGVELVITGGELEQVFGGSEGASENGNVTVSVLGGTITRRVFGGCYNECSVLGTYETSYYVNGHIRLIIGGGANIAFTYGNDMGIYARSRQKTVSGSETTELIFADNAGYTTYKDKIGAQSSWMTTFMGNVTAADDIHYFEYTADGATLIGKCAYDGCEITPRATLSLDSDLSLQYTGKPITPAVVTTSNWYGDEPEITYSDNTKEGTATASITANGATVSLNFEIEPVYFRSLSLGESIAINFKAARSFLEARNFEKIEFYMDGKLMQVITGIPAGKEDRVSFTFNQLTPAQMGKEVTARFYFADGTYDERSTSVLAYAMSMLKKDATEAKLKTLLVDMLGYGAASQTYVGDTEALVSAGEYAGLGTTADPALVNHTALKDAPETEQAAWLSAGLNLKDSVTVRLKFSADSADGLTLKVTCDGNTWEITDFQATTGGYYAYFSGLNPAQLRETMEAALYNADGAKVSKTLTYSVVSYAHAVANGTDTALQPLMKALMRYGDAVADWVGEEYVASVTADGKTTYFETLEEAIERANAADTDAKVVVWESISIGSAIEINNNVTIVNAPGKDITISRGDLAANMFTVNKGGSLTLGTNGDTETGKLIIDGASTDAIAFRIVKVNSGASFILGKNAALQGANSTVAGGALYVAGTAELYGAISDNKSQNTGAGLFVADGATVECTNATFSGNDSTEKDKNGGAVYVSAGGQFTDNGSTYTGNQARNGGAIFLAADETVDDVAKKAQVALNGGTNGAFTQNAAATANGGAIFVNGGTLTVSGYTFEGNTAKSNADGAIHIANGSATVENAVFRGSSAQKIYVNAALSFQNLTGAQIVKMKTAATITLTGNVGTNVQLKPQNYTDDIVVVTGEGVDFTAIAVTPKGDGSYWSIDENGVLQSYAVASITTAEGTTLYNTLTEAVEAANSADAATEIVVLKSVSLVAAIEIRKDVTFVNASGETITISRGDLTADMFTVAEGGSLTLGTNDTAETGKLILDGASASPVDGRTVTVATGATFTLNQNATLCNANSTVAGGALHVAGEAEVHGTISDNKTTDVGAGLFVASGATVSSSNAIFSGNDTGTSNKNGGAVYVAGTFTDIGSTYIGNQARNGGAIFIPTGGTVVLNANDAAANKIFRNNAAVKVDGGAIYVNGGTLQVSGYAFEGNTGTTHADSAIHIASGSATVENAVFQGDSAQAIYVNGKLTFQNLTDAQIAALKTETTVTLGGEAGTNVQLKPYSYTEGTVVVAGTGVDFSTIAVTPDGETQWCIDADGKLQVLGAVITGNTPRYFTSLDAALTAAGTGDTIELLVDTTLTEAITVDKAITIVNASGKDITISRGDLTADMFTVAEGGSLTLGTNDTGETGKLIIDGTSEAAIAYRTVTVNSGASFTLGKNATLQNAKASVAGGAIYTASANTFVYGTIRDNVGKTGAGMHVAADPNAAGDAMVQISGASFLSNRSSGTGGALQIDANAKVNCADAHFEGNKALTGSTYSNGGTVYVAGTFKDTNSTYTANEGKNGGAIFLGASTANVELTGTDAAKALFSGNIATGDTGSRGGAIFVNGGTLTVSGYIFEGNTSTGTAANTGEGAIHVASGSATVNNTVFQGTSEQKIYVNNKLTFQNLTNAQIVEMKAAATITLSGDAGANVQLKPASYTVGEVVIDGTGVDFSTIAVTPDGETQWCIDADGKLQALGAIITGDTPRYYASLNEALAAAETGATIELLVDTTLTEAITVTKAITIVNAPGREITITRGSDLTADIFTVSAGGSLTLGTDDATGKLILDGTSDSAIAGRTVTVESGATFTLGKNATLCNANSTVNGGALWTAGTTYLYGTISNNKSTVAGAGLCVEAGANVTCENAIFADNTVPASVNGGAIYVAGAFTDTNSTYTGNVAKNGGAIFLGKSTAVVTLTGTDAEKAVFKNNQATGASTSKGGALYNNGGTLTVDGYTFTGNTCQQSITSPTDEKNAQIWHASGTTSLANITMN